jgi:hypothetical protein
VAAANDPAIASSENMASRLASAEPRFLIAGS